MVSNPTLEDLRPRYPGYLVMLSQVAAVTSDRERWEDHSEDHPYRVPRACAAVLPHALETLQHAHPVSARRCLRCQRLSALTACPNCSGTRYGFRGLAI